MSSTVAQLKGLRYQPPDWSYLDYGADQRESWLSACHIRSFPSGVKVVHLGYNKDHSRLNDMFV